MDALALVLVEERQRAGSRSVARSGTTAFTSWRQGSDDPAHPIDDVVADLGGPHFSTCAIDPHVGRAVGRWLGLVIADGT